MSHLERRQRVLQAKAQLASQLEHTCRQADSLQNTIGQSLSPARVITAGAATGFLAGLLGPGRLPRNALLHAKALGALPALVSSLLPVWEQLQAFRQPATDTAPAAQADDIPPEVP